jgi:hypothetical protein
VRAGSTTATTRTLSFAGCGSLGWADDVADRTSAPASRTTALIRTFATRSPERKSSSQASVVVPVHPGPRSVWLPAEATCCGSWTARNARAAGPPRFRTLSRYVIVSPTAGAAGDALACTERSGGRPPPPAGGGGVGGAGGGAPMVIAWVAADFPAAAAVIVGEPALLSRK